MLSCVAATNQKTFFYIADKTKKDNLGCDLLCCIVVVFAQAVMVTGSGGGGH
jgi:hypothetical protein